MDGHEELGVVVFMVAHDRCEVEAISIGQPRKIDNRNL